MARRIHIKGVRRQEIDASLLSYVYFLEAKRIARERREREKVKKAERRKRDGAKDQGGRHER
jgi:uncharacterized protein (DUF2132 family)